MRYRPKRWLYTRATWWQFWMLQSGYIGGAILGVLILVLFIAFIASALP